MWENTARVGVGIAVNEKRETWIVAKYSPPGNYKSQYINNVRIRKPGGKKN